MTKDRPTDKNYHVTELLVYYPENTMFPFILRNIKLKLHASF